MTPEDKKTKIKYLLIRIKDNDLLALGELLELKTKDIQIISYKILKDKSLVEDVVNEVMVSFIQNIHNFNDERNINGWLNVVAINKSIDFKRKMFEHETEYNSNFSNTSNARTEEEILERINVLGVLEKMKDIERYVLLEKLLNNSSYEAIANKFSISYKQTRRIFKSAKLKFMRFYKK
jgi:RNA polymerase sigma factor (sigma-70 family)